MLHFFLNLGEVKEITVISFSISFKITSAPIGAWELTSRPFMKLWLTNRSNDDEKRGHLEVTLAIMKTAFCQSHQSHLIASVQVLEMFVKSMAPFCEREFVLVDEALAGHEGEVGPEQGGTKVSDQTKHYSR